MRSWRKVEGIPNEFSIEGDVVWIKLTQGQETCVDLEDWSKVAPIRWVACKTRHGYYYARAVLFLHKLVVPSLSMTDHKKGDSLDNRKSQLRPSSVSQNCINRGLNRNNITGFKGVQLRKGKYRSREKWVAQLGSGRDGNYLGTFDNPVEAAMAYDRAALAKYGEFARLNFPRGQFGAFAL